MFLVLAHSCHSCVRSLILSFILQFIRSLMPLHPSAFNIFSVLFILPFIRSFIVYLSFICHFVCSRVRSTVRSAIMSVTWKTATICVMSYERQEPRVCGMQHFLLQVLQAAFRAKGETRSLTSHLATPDLQRSDAPCRRTAPRSASTFSLVRVSSLQ